MKKAIFAAIVLGVWLVNCSSPAADNKQQVLLVRIQAAYHEKIIFQQHGFNGAKSINIDSGIVQSGLDSFTFHFPAGGQHLFTLNIAGSGIRIPVINDAKNIELYYNYATHRYSFKGSPASTELKSFADEQLQLAHRAQLLKRYIDSAQKKAIVGSLIKDSIANYSHINTVFFDNYKNFADTVQSPAAFMAIYDAIEFGDDTAGLKKFITKAATHFAQNEDVTALAKNVTDYLNAIEKPYMPGDVIPELTLPDDFGASFSTYSLKGKYVFINIWATFCNDCLKYGDAIKKAQEVLPPGKFEAVSIAVDDQKQAWLNIINSNNYTWPQLIDVNMWSGEAFKKLRFNNIPYNFLIGPDDRLIAKNIKADSVVAVIQNSIK